MKRAFGYGINLKKKVENENKHNPTKSKLYWDLPAAKKSRLLEKSKFKK